MNKVIMVGNIATDTELRTVGDGKQTATFRIAVRRKFKNKAGQYESDFFSVCVWGESAEYVHKYGPKGRAISLCGRLQNRSYQAQDGSTRYVTEIVADEVQLLGEKVEKQEEKPGAFKEIEEDSLPFE